MNFFIGTLLDGFAKGAIYSLIAVALVLVWRATRVVNFAQAAQAVLSTYIGLMIFERTDSYALALLLAVITGALLGALVDALVMRPLANHAKGSSANVVPIIATLGLLGLFQSIAQMIWGGEFRTYPTPVSVEGLSIGSSQVAFSLFDLFVILTVVVVMIAFSYLLQRTRVGLALRAAAFRPDIAALAGIRVARMRILGWALAGAAGAVAGVLIAPTTFLGPNSLDVLLILGFTAAVIGGLDSLIGAVTGGVVLGLGLSFFTAYVSGATTFLAVFIVLILALLIRPRGIFGTAEARRA
jgi:branched-chain amino acid transport system permease protein